MSSQRSINSDVTTHGWLAVLWIFSLTMLLALPCPAQDNAQLALPNQLTASVVPNSEASNRYHLPRSNNHSIYFLPGSAELGESARQVLADTATHLTALPQLIVTLEAYSDESEIAQGLDLRKARVAAIISAMQELNIPKRRILTASEYDHRTDSASCKSEYCRQSYRRVRLEFSRDSGD